MRLAIRHRSSYLPVRDGTRILMPRAVASVEGNDLLTGPRQTPFRASAPEFKTTQFQCAAEMEESQRIFAQRD